MLGLDHDNIDLKPKREGPHRPPTVDEEQPLDPTSLLDHCDTGSPGSETDCPTCTHHQRGRSAREVGAGCS